MSPLLFHLQGWSESRKILFRNSCLLLYFILSRSHVSDAYPVSDSTEPCLTSVKLKELAERLGHAPRKVTKG